MSETVNFKNVSKRYDLGLTRRSLPNAVTSLFSRTHRRGGINPDSKELWALRDVDFSLKHGESLALIGPNGAGKTTVLKLLAGITRQTAGDIKINGKLSALIELGAGFHPDLTGRENIYLNGAILGIRKEELNRRFDEIVAFSELERFIETPVKRYSSGMAVRLGFAVAACIEPEIMLVDEVLAVGDASFRKKSMDRISELLTKGTTIIFVSHNLWLVQAVCSRALYLDKGRVVSDGATPDVIAQYDRAINEERARKLERVEGDIVSKPVGEVEITSVEVLQSDNRSEELHNDKPTEVRISYHAYRDYDDANIVVRIVRSDGLTCCMIRTSVDGVPLPLRRGKGSISVKLDPLQLYGGSYYAQTIVRDESDSFPLDSKLSDWFYVAGSALSHQEMNGVFEPHRTWEHRPSFQSLEATEDSNPSTIDLLASSRKE